MYLKTIRNLKTQIFIYIMKAVNKYSWYREGLPHNLSFKMYFDGVILVMVQRFSEC